jgi:integrase|tara:strand:+ start:135 stop:1001 length:867 start_codon:yes stop_codon:yes gene_type:complete
MKNPKLLTEIHKKLTLKGWEKLQSKRGLKVIELLGAGMLVTEVNEQHIEHLVETLQERGLQGSTINRYLAALSKMLSHAHKRHAIYHMERMPFIEWEDENEGRDRYLMPEEEQEIIRLMTDWDLTDYLELYLFLIDSGMRLGEALSFKKSNVDEHFVVHLKGAQTKNGHRRSIPLTKRAVSIVNPLLSNIERGDTVFGHLNYWRAENIWRKLRKAMDLQDDKDFVIHCLRHTCATRLAQSGKIELHLIGDMLGHRSWVMIKRYAHLIPSNLRGAIAVLDNHNELSANG